MAPIRPSGLCPGLARAHRVEADSPMEDLVYIAAGFAILGVFVLYVIGLKRI
jgi:hypothetical protein